MSLYCSSEKNSEKPLKIDLLIRDLGKKGPAWATPKIRFTFSSGNNKRGS